MSEGRIVVSTKHIRQSANAAHEELRRAKELFERLNGTALAAGSHWEGRGYRAFRTAWKKQEEKAQEIFLRFEEQVADLQRMAGIYEQAERESAQSASGLPRDVIR